MAVLYSENPATKTIEVTVNGTLTQQDFDEILPRFEAFMAAHEKIRLIEVVEDLKGADPMLMWQGMKFDFKAIPHISHCAVVSDIPWMSPMAKAAGAFMPMKVRTFDMAQLDEARAWIATAD